MKKILFASLLLASLLPASTVYAGSWGDGNSNSNWNGNAYNNMNNNAYSNAYSNAWGDGSGDMDMDGDIDITIKSRGRGRGQAYTRGSAAGRGYGNGYNNWDNNFQNYGEQRYMNNNSYHYAPQAYQIPPPTIAQQHYQNQVQAAKIKAAQVVAVKEKIAHAVVAHMKAARAHMRAARAYEEVIQATAAQEAYDLPDAVVVKATPDKVLTVESKAPVANANLLLNN